MIQHYTRLTIVYAADGHTVTVANAAELESLTGLKVGAGGWAALCRWIEDQSERMDGRKQGRRQDDDEHLIYRDDRGTLCLRTGVSDGLVLALECVAQSLVRSDVLPEEIGPGHPAAGVHGYDQKKSCLKMDFPAVATESLRPTCEKVTFDGNEE